MFNFFSKEDKQLYNMLGHLNMAEKEISLKDNSETEIYEVACPDDEYAFLHEAAIVEYEGTGLAAWYSGEEKGQSDKKGQKTVERHGVILKR